MHSVKVKIVHVVYIYFLNTNLLFRFQHKITYCNFITYKLCSALSVCVTRFCGIVKNYNHYLYKDYMKPIYVFNKEIFS